MDKMKKASRRVWGWLFLAAGLVALPAAAAETPPGPFEGFYLSTGKDRDEIKLYVYQADRSLYAEGSRSGSPVVISGSVAACGVGALEGWRESGELIALSLSADGQTLKIERQGASDVLLERQEVELPLPPPSTGGPMSGDWQAIDQGALLAEVSLVERSGMVAGLAMVTGDAVAVTGRLVGQGLASGAVTFVDGSQVAFTAELSSDGSQLYVTGFGDVIKLSRRGAP